jgi:RNA polymerase sigma factor (sigma-70 family)
MATQLLPPAGGAARRRTSLHTLQHFTDAQLLERFAARHSESAFAVLVERHGPLVHSVCHRILQNPADAEDAFQAAFLVLARKAHTIQKHHSVASWLYKVAYRIALRARSAIARRRTQEREAIQSQPPPTPTETARRELGEAIDEEVHRLPEKYRAPILLCYLQGQTNEEAARQLSCPIGTLKVRLMRARDILRKRLARRGLTLSAVGLAALLFENAALAAVPATVAGATVSAVTVGGASASVAGLAAGALKAMCLAKLKVAAALLLTVVIGCTADGLAQRAAAAAETKQVEPAPLSPSPPAPILVVSCE